jgi:CoA-dependent NAD(P)H sulfur oxidoreductase
MRLVVIGGVAAGTKAASRARRVNPDLEITIYQEEPETSISECGLPYFLSGVVGRRDQLVARTPEAFAKNGIEARTRHRVESIDPDAKELTVKDLASGETFDDAYDRLIIATGARAILPGIEGSDLEGVFALRFLTDADAILEHVRERSPKKAVVVGGGYIGLEVAESLTLLGMGVSLVEAAEQLAGAYGPEVAEIIEDHMKEKGVDCLFTGDAVEAFLGDEEGRVRAARFGGREIEAQVVVAGIGVRPEVSLAEAAGAKIGATGAIRTDKYLETSLPDVWSAGDCAETTNLVTGEPGWFPLGDTANQMGRVAGTNAASENGASLTFPGVLGTGVFKVFDLGVARTGLSVRDAEEAGVDVVTAAVDARSKAGYYPGVQPVFLKLIADGETGRLLGAETAGGSADKLVDVCATAIWGRLAYPDLINLDLAYAPPFGPALSPVIQAASVLSNEFDRRKEGVRASE